MKTWIKILSLVPAAVLVMLAADVKVDYSHSTDFSRYKTYSWLKVQAENTLWEDRIQRDVDAELAAKGWQKVASGGDAAVAAVGSTKTNNSCRLSMTDLAAVGSGEVSAMVLRPRRLKTSPLAI